MRIRLKKDVWTLYRNGHGSIIRHKKLSEGTYLDYKFGKDSTTVNRIATQRFGLIIARVFCHGVPHFVLWVELAYEVISRKKREGTCI